MAAIHSRYARAFADVVFGQKLDSARMSEELDQFAGLVASSPELSNVWGNPSVPSPQKLKLLDSIAAQSGVARPMRNLLAILIDKRRIGALPEIAAQFKNEVNERLGFADAEITSARELAAGERSSLEAQLSAATGKKVRARYLRDASLLGGAVARVGSTIYDGSVRGQLQKMKAAIAG